MIAAIAAAIAEEEGTALSGIRVLSVKKLLLLGEEKL